MPQTASQQPPFYFGGSQVPSILHAPRVRGGNLHPMEGTGGNNHSKIVPVDDDPLLPMTERERYIANKYRHLGPISDSDNAKMNYVIQRYRNNAYKKFIDAQEKLDEAKIPAHNTRLIESDSLIATKMNARRQQAGGTGLKQPRKRRS